MSIIRDRVARRMFAGRLLKQYDNVKSALVSRKYTVDRIRPFLRTEITLS
jgi:hypothetical protein